MFTKNSFILTIILIISFTSVVQAQQVNTEKSEIEKQKNTAYLELFGNGLVYTINYERVIAENIFLRFGGGYLGLQLGDSKFRAFSIPIMLNKLYGKRNAKLELGTGILIAKMNSIFEDDVDTNHEGLVFNWFDFGITTTIGYRHQLNNGGIFRIGIQPRYLFGSNTLEELANFTISTGISFGGSF